MANVIEGTAAGDFLQGTDGDEIINGRGGRDRINTGDGNDVVNGGGGSDTISGGRGDDTLNGGGGRDTFFLTTPARGGTGPGGGIDIIDGGPGTDTLALTFDLNTATITQELDGSLRIESSTRDGFISVRNVELFDIRSGTFSLTTFTLDELLADAAANTSTRSSFDLDGSVTTSQLLVPGDSDFHSFTVRAGQIVDFDFDFSDLSAMRGSGEPQVTIVDRDGNLVVNLSQQAGLADGFTFTQSGTFFLSITSDGPSTADLQTGEYSFSAEVTGTSPFVVTGTRDDDVLEGSDRFGDIIQGFAGDDLLIGNGGSDTLNGGRGNDTLLGGGSDDILLGRSGDDTLEGGQGRDSLFGGGGADVIDGGDGADTISGGRGRDFILGGSGDDVIDGGRGADNINGGNGADVLEGGRGNDLLTGGDGLDFFVFAEGSGFDRIADFEDGVDRIDLTGFGFDSFDDIVVEESNGTVFVLIDSDTSIELTGITDIGQITADDFIFGS